MSEPGNHEQREPSEEQNIQPPTSAHETQDEGPAGTFERQTHEEQTARAREELTPEEFTAQQQAELARSGYLPEALNQGPLPPELGSPLNEEAQSILGQQAVGQLGAIDTGDRPATDQEVERIGHMLAQSGYTREFAEQQILALRNISDAQKQHLLGLLPEAVPQASREEMYSQREGESEQEYMERLVGIRKIEQGQNEQLIANAQALAHQIETESMYNVIDDPNLRQQMEGRFKAAKHLLHHKMEEFKEYMKAPPKEWLMRGFRYSSVGLAGLFLFIIWEMQLIGKLAAKKR